MSPRDLVNLQIELARLIAERRTREDICLLYQSQPWANWGQISIKCSDKV